MKLLLLILITLLTATTYCWAEENHEVIWETERMSGLNDVEISPLGEIFYNTKDSIVQVRSVETGDLIDEILFPNTARLDAISISADGRYMAVSGEPKYIFIYDLVLEREVKRLTAIVWEEEEFGENVEYEAEKWVCSSISPDGSKVTGVAISDAGVKKSSLIVIDIESEQIIYESRRILYDRSIQKPDNYEWISSEFSPDGKYIISQLDYDFYHGNESDSIYIHDVNNFEVYDVVLNRYYKENNYYNLSPNKSLFTYYSSDTKKIHIYHLPTKDIFETNINPDIWTFTFLRNSDIIIYGFDWEFHIYNYKNDKTIYEYENLVDGRTTSLDDRVLISLLNGIIYGMNTLFSETSINQEYEEEIIISPNPTDSFVNINIGCYEPNINYSIYNIDSILITEDIVTNQEDNFTVDFTPYPTGVYFVSFLCNGELKTYKIIKEG